MKMYLRKAMQNVATYVELALSAFLTIVIVVLIVKLIGESFFHLNGEGPELSYYLESAMTLAIGIEFVKMLCTHTPGPIIEVLLFATSRQMIVEHLTGTETLLGIAAIAGLCEIRKYLFCNFDVSDHILCRGSQTVRHANLIAGVKIPEESNCLLRDVVARQLVSKEKSISIGACIYYKDCALRIDNMRDDLITRVEVIKTL